MMKKGCMIMMGVIFSVAGFSQTTQQKVEKEWQNLPRRENAGKADVISTNKKSIFDSTTFIHKNVINSKAVKWSAKKQHCKKKIKQ